MLAPLSSLKSKSRPSGFPLFLLSTKIHLAPLAGCPGNRGTGCVFHDSALILLWKLSAWGGTPTSGKTLLSELISREQPSLSISHVCLRTARSAEAPSEEQQGEQVGGEGRGLKTPTGDWKTVHSSVLCPSVPEKALPWHVTVNTGRLHGNTAIWQESMGWDMAPMRQIIPQITISSPSCAIRVMTSECAFVGKREQAVKHPCQMFPMELLKKQYTTIYVALIETQITSCLGSFWTALTGHEEEFGEWEGKGWQPFPSVVYYKCHIQVGIAEMHPCQHLSLSGKSLRWRMVNMGSCTISTNVPVGSAWAFQYGNCSGKVMYWQPYWVCENLNTMPNTAQPKEIQSRYINMTG